MRKFFGILLIVISAIFIIFFLASFAGGIAESIEGSPDAFGTFFLSFVFFLVPGGLLLFFGIRLLIKPKISKAPNVNPNPQPMRNIPEQPKQTMPDQAIGDNIVFTSSSFSVKVSNSFTMDGIEIKEREPDSKEPISVACPGCGAKTTVYPNKAATCEYCGTVVNYKEG